MYIMCLVPLPVLFVLAGGHEQLFSYLGPAIFASFMCSILIGFLILIEVKSEIHRKHQEEHQRWMDELLRLLDELNESLRRQQRFHQQRRYTISDAAQEQRSLTFFGLGASASNADIKKAYRRMAAKHHPDRGGDTAKMQEATQHYNVLQKARGFK